MKTKQISLFRSSFLFLALIAINFGIIANIRTIEPINFKIKECYSPSITNPGDNDQTGRRQFVADIYKYDKDLVFVIKNFLAECESDYKLDASVDGNCITLNPYPVNPSPDPCLCRRDLSFELDDVLTESWNYFIRWEGQPKENGVILLQFDQNHEIKLGFYQDKIDFILGSCVMLLYNPGDENHEPFFAHITAYPGFTANTYIVNLNGIGTFGNQIQIGSIRIDGLKVYMTPANVEIPSEFWGLNMGQETFNPAKIHGEEELLLYDFSDEITEDVYVWDFFNGVLPGCKRTATYSDDEYDLMAQTENSKKLKVWRDFRHDFVSDSFAGSHHRSFGTFGKGIASNLIYPAYKLPEGAIPTSFSCIGLLGCDFHGSRPLMPWHFVDNKWMEDTEFNTDAVDDAKADETCRIIMIGEWLTVSAQGEFSVIVHTIDGVLISETTGCETLSLRLDVSSGTPLLVSIQTSNREFTRKIIRK